MHDNVVRRIERFVLPLVGQHSDGAVVLVADDAAVAMFTRELPAIEIERVAVAVAAGVAEDAHVAILFEPAHLAVVRNVTPDQVTAGAIPGATLRPSRAGPKPFTRRVANFAFPEMR